MKTKRGFTLIELMVVVAIIALLIAILLPSLARARKVARTAVCMTNQRALVQSYRMYFQESKNVLSSTGHGPQGAWDYQLFGSGKDLNGDGNVTTDDVAKYYDTNGTMGSLDKMRFRPENAITAKHMPRDQSINGTSTTVWDCVVGPGQGSTGSYAMNNWMYKPQGSAPNTGNYRIKSLSMEFSVPVFVDSVWHDIKPLMGDEPADSLSDPSAGGDNRQHPLSDATLDRHSRAVNVAFWDGHTENVKVGYLWTLKWSADWTRTVSKPVPAR